MRDMLAGLVVVTDDDALAVVGGDLLHVGRAEAHEQGVAHLQGLKRRTHAQRRDVALCKDLGAAIVDDVHGFAGALPVKETLLEALAIADRLQAHHAAVHEHGDA